MVKAALFKSTLREVRGSLGRYFAIMAIIALGVGCFSGLSVTQSAFLETGDQYVSEQKLYDFRLLSTLGFTDEDALALSSLPRVEAAEGARFLDVIFYLNDSSFVTRIESITESLNLLDLKCGRMPEAPNEVLGDPLMFGEDDLGTTIHISGANSEDTLGALKYDGYTLVGVANSPMYLSTQRGSTSIGSGSIACVLYMLPDGFELEYYHEIYLTLERTGVIFSDEYDEALDAAEAAVTAALDERADVRFESVKSEYGGELASARQELDDGWAEYESTRAETQRKLDDALAELNGYEQDYAEAEAQLAEAEERLDGRTLDELKAELADGRAKISAGWQEYNDGLEEYNTKFPEALEELNASEEKLAEALKELNAAESLLGGLMPSGARKQYEDSRAQLDAAWEEYYSQKAEADARLGDAYNTLISSAAECDRAEALISEAEEQMGGKSLDELKSELAAKRAELDDGWREYYDSQAEAETGFAEAEKKLGDGEAEYADAEKQLDELAAPDCYVLKRDTNAGYVSFENDSGVVEGISKVIPWFFFLVAALICVTTMTRMVDEQRTQIGVLKALGYSRISVMNKYMAYSGSAAIIGCVIGFLIGTWLFPKAIWQAYSVLYGFTDVVYAFDPRLAVICFIVSVLCSIGTTWLSCRVEFTNVPAALMRPKAPDAGRRVLLERVPFIWKRLKFLHKISVRNIFRYKKRMLMMLLGIGGCTALLFTGLAMNDSIRDIVARHFGEIMTYDYSVSFSEPQTEEDTQAFSDEFAGRLDSFIFVHNDTVDLINDKGVKSVTVIAAEDEALERFVKLHDDGGEAIPFPSNGEAVVTAKLADILNIKAGDAFTLRYSDMRELELVCSGVCDNYAYHYVYFSLDTYRTQLGSEPDIKTALVNVPDGEDPHKTSTEVNGFKGVATILVSVDYQAMVQDALDSLNYVIWLIIFCAGALAVVVIYNLTNINITERVREIATIKVLGFYRKEVAAYVFRENVVLTAFGTILGLIGGKFLHIYVMSQIKIDFVSFVMDIPWTTYLISAALTLAFAWLVDLSLKRKLRRVSMAESLKSVE